MDKPFYDIESDGHHIEYGFIGNDPKGVKLIGYPEV